MALGTWDTTTPIMGIEYHTQIKVLDIHFTNTIRLSAANSWTHVARNIRTQAQDAYYKELRLHQLVQYVNTYVLAKPWYTVLIFPPPTNSIRQINTAVSWYIWRGQTFRVPISTLYRTNEQGGWTLINIEAKCRMLLLFGIRGLEKKVQSITARWLGKLGLLHTRTNPPIKTEHSTTSNICNTWREIQHICRLVA
jgi:hypothetical protein